eukprot:COSAG01_NODE_44072_length_422_cov_42.724458_2_plen_33_part_01
MVVISDSFVCSHVICGDDRTQTSCAIIHELLRV